jgi:predicted nucleotidyltransferase
MELFAYSLRKKVAREAALLLYTMQEREFKQAKERAAKILGLRIMPTNLEVAEELDSIAEEYEGSERKERLIRMRKEALEIMESLREFNPRLIGSVWRGTANKNSDIDIVIFSQKRDFLMDILRGKGFKIARTELTPAIKNGSGEALHIYISFPSGDEAEVVVKGLEDMQREERCEIYGDLKKGLGVDQLREVIEKNPLQRFLPEKR